MADIPLVLEPETLADAEAIERLNERVFGPGRFAKTAYRLREEAEPDLSLSFVARVGTLLVGANRMTPILIGETPALLLGPLIVEPAFRSQGIGEALVMRSLEAARQAGASLSILVGDPPYYARMGFKPAPPGRVKMPGPVDPARVLYCEIAARRLQGRQRPGVRQIAEPSAASPNDPPRLQSPRSPPRVTPNSPSTSCVCSPSLGAALAAAIASPSIMIRRAHRRDRAARRAGSRQIDAQAARHHLRVGEHLRRPN